MPRPPKPTEHLDKVRHLMGRKPDHEIALLCDSTPSIVGRYRRKHNIPAYDGYKFGNGQEPPTKDVSPGQKKIRKRSSKVDIYRSQVGKIPDAEIARLAGITVEGVRMYRRRHGISLAPDARGRRGAKKKQRSSESPVMSAILATPEPKRRRRRSSKIDPFRDQVGQVADSEIAVMADVTPEAVRAFRRKHNIDYVWRSTLQKQVPYSPASAVVERSTAITIVEPMSAYSVQVDDGKTVSDYFLLAGDITIAAHRATEAIAEGKVHGTVTGIRYLGKALD